MTDHAELRLKVLELAREMLHNSYVETKARMHNEWSLKADVAWKTTQRMLPYPKLPEYFTEVAVLDQAHTLWAFVQTGQVTHSKPLTEQVSQQNDLVDSAPDVEPTHAEHTYTPDTIADIPLPIQLPSVAPNTDLDVAAFITSPQPILDAPNAPSNRGLKVLPAWMTPKRG